MSRILQKTIVLLYALAVLSTCILFVPQQKIAVNIDSGKGFSTNVTLPIWSTFDNETLKGENGEYTIMVRYEIDGMKLLTFLFAYTVTAGSLLLVIRS